MNGCYRYPWLGVGILALCTVFGCSSFDPHPMKDEPFLERGQTKQEGKVRVTVAALGAEETERVFGVPLADEGIQPVWVEIENRDKNFLWFMSAGLDPEYYAPNEAAYKMHSSFSGETNEQIDQHIEKMALPKLIMAEATTSGFVYTNLDEGRKFLTVDLIGINQAIRFTYSVHVPGLQMDFEQVDWDNLYPKNEIVHYDDEAEFRKALESWPCCTTNKDGTLQGDPVNVVVIGKRSNVAPSFIGRGWQVVEGIYAGSLWKTVKSFLFGSRYRYSPVSPLFFFERSQDFGAQKARATIDERNHLRAWLSPIRFRGLPVWAVQISRDIGVRFTTKTWNLTTHKIDPDVDEARNYLIEDLIYSGGLTKLGWLKALEPVDRSSPRENLTGDPYYTDGFRAVLMLDGTHADLDELALFPWEHPVADKARKFQESRHSGESLEDPHVHPNIKPDSPPTPNQGIE